MPFSLRSMLVLLAVLATSANVHAAGKAAHRPAAHPARKAPRHTSHTKTNHYRRPAVHRQAVQHARHGATRRARQPAARTVSRVVRRYPVYRLARRYVRQWNYLARNYRYHRRYTHSYYPGRYNWRSNYYNRGYGRSRRHLSRGVHGIVEGVQGNAGNGTVVVKVVRTLSRRFRYGTGLAGANRGRRVSSAHRFHVNNATRYEILSVPRKARTFASLHKGEQVLILRRGNQSNTAQKVEVFPPRRR